MKLFFKKQKIYLTGIHFDSRQIKKGYVFVAVIGSQTDGHNFIEDAIKRGAKTIVCKILPANLFPNVKYLQVEDTTEALGQLASLWNGNPSGQLQLIGVTGTNGKTTIATLLYELFKQLGYKVGLISTIYNCINDKIIPSTQTTPDIIMINYLLAHMVFEGCKYAFMEVSSHAIDQKRIFNLCFKGGIFSNLTRDHLDYHKTFENYRNTKKKFFDLLSFDSFALINKDDKNGMFMLQNTKAKKHTYSFLTLSDFNGRILELYMNGTLMEINKKEIFTLFSGKFNAYNLLAVYGAAILLGEPSDIVCVKLSKLCTVPGRFEVFQAVDYTVVLDYAHTPDALINVLKTIKGISNRNGKIITVVGCGGDRDKGKRPIMAKEAVKLSQQVILTSDNPRFEDSSVILEDMLSGVDQDQRSKILCIIDRKEAIRTACLISKPGDIVLIAGKGHEIYQEIQGVKYPLNDREIIKKMIN